MIGLGSIFASVRKRFYDNFASRANTTGSLGTATDGSSWNAVNQIITVTTGAAKSGSVPTPLKSGNYDGTTFPMATVVMPTTNNVIDLSGTNEGSAVALWVQSSSDWWMVNIEGTQNVLNNYAYTTAYSYVYGQNAGTTNYGAPYSTATAWGYVTVGPYSSYTAGGTYYGYRTVGSPYSFATYSGTQPATSGYGYYVGTGQNVTNYTASSYVAAGSTYTYTSSGYTTYVAKSTTTYNEFLKIKQSVASTVSVITSSLISTSQTIKSLRVFTSGNVITARAFSDSNFVTQIGTDLVYTATGATVNTQYGIAISSSSYNQSDIIGTSVDMYRN